MVKISAMLASQESLADEYLSGKLSYGEAYNSICQVLQDLRDLVGKVPFYQKRQLNRAIKSCKSSIDILNLCASSTSPFYSDVRLSRECHRMEISRNNIRGAVFHTPCFETGRGCTCCTIFCQMEESFDPVRVIPAEAKSKVYLFEVLAVLDVEANVVRVSTTGDISAEPIRQLFNKLENLRWKDVLL